MHSVQKSLCVRVCTYVCICSRSSQLSFFSLAKYPRSFIVFVAAIEYKEGPAAWQAGRLAGSVVRRWAPRQGEGRSRALRQLSYTKLAAGRQFGAAAMLGKAEQRWNMCIGLGSVNCWRTQRTRKNCKCASDHSDEGQVAKIVFLFFFSFFYFFPASRALLGFFFISPFLW